MMEDMIILRADWNNFTVAVDVPSRQKCTAEPSRGALPVELRMRRGTHHCKVRQNQTSPCGLYIKFIPSRGASPELPSHSKFRSYNDRLWVQNMIFNCCLEVVLDVPMRGKGIFVLILSCHKYSPRCRWTFLRSVENILKNSLRMGLSWFLCDWFNAYWHTLMRIGYLFKYVQ